MIAYLITISVIFLIIGCIHFSKWNPYDGFMAVIMLIYSVFTALGKCDMNTYMHITMWYWFIIAVMNGIVGTTKKDKSHLIGMALNLIFGCFSMYFYLKM